MILNDGIFKIALYRATNGNWVDGAINAFSGFGGFSHCEIVFPDGWSFSSTTRDASTDPRTGKPKPDGTRWKLIDFDPAKWAIAPLYDLASLTDQEKDHWSVRVALARRHCDAIAPARYDYKGVLRFVPGIGLFCRQSPDRYFCSEAVVEVAHEAGLLLDMVPYLTSPNRLASTLGLK